MKRLVILTILLVVATSGCRRGLRCWGLRGDRCATPYVAPYAAPPAYPPAYAAPAYPAPAYAAPSYPAPNYCPPMECDPCAQPDPCCAPGYGQTMYTDPGYSTPGAPGLDSSTNYSPDRIYYSKPVADRIVTPHDQDSSDSSLET